MADFAASVAISSPVLSLWLNPKEILQHPEDYYVNVHNADFPAGALRVALEVPRREVLVEPEEVVEHEHLPVAVGSRPNPDRGNREPTRDLRRHRLGLRPYRRDRRQHQATHEHSRQK